MLKQKCKKTKKCKILAVNIAIRKKKKGSLYVPFMRYTTLQLKKGNQQQNEIYLLSLLFLIKLGLFILKLNSLFNFIQYII